MPFGNNRPYATTTRYSAGARWFHWITAALMFTVIPLGWIFGAFKTKPGNPEVFVAPFPGTPEDYAAGHMTIGLVLFATVGARIIYRTFNAPPVLPNDMAVWERRLAHLTHWLIYAALIIMPVSGYIMRPAISRRLDFSASSMYQRRRSQRVRARSPRSSMC